MDFSAAWDSARAIVDYTLTIAPLLIVAVLVFGLFHLVAVFASRAAQRVARRWGKHPSLAVVLARISRWGVDLVGLLVALMIAMPGFRPAQLVSILGLGSVAIGFAFRDILQNFLAGLLILVQEPFRIGDQIVTGTYEGTVEEIQTRATYIRTYDNRRVVIPNTTLFTGAVVVNTAYPIRRVEYDLGIGYGDDVARARELILQVLGRLPEVLDEPAPDVLCMELGQSAVQLRVRWWIRPPERADALDARDSVLAAAKQALQAEGIDFPFQTVQLLFHDQTEAVDGDRARQREGWPAGREAPPARRWQPTAEPQRLPTRRTQEAG